MLEKIKENLILVLAIAVIALVLLQVKSCNDRAADKASFQQFDKSIAAIDSKVTKGVNAQGDTVFTKGAASFTLKDLINSDAFKSLSAQNQQFYTELQKVKGLVASSNATILAQSEIIKNLKPSAGESITGDSVCFAFGSTLLVKDSTAHLNFNHTLTFGEQVKSDLKYSYKTTIQTSFIRNKDKSIRVEYKLDDPNANVLSGQAFIIPQEQQSGFAKFMSKQAKWVFPVAAFVGGAYVGYKIVK